MKTLGPVVSSIVAISIPPTLIFLVACQHSQQPPSIPATISNSTSTEKLFVVFEGPWAFAPDPKDTGSVIAIAPKTKGHSDLYYRASNESTLTAGAYALSLPAHSGQALATADPDIAQARIPPQALQSALDSKSVRYVIHLAKPEEYIVASRSKSRLDTKYPPAPSAEKNYASAVSLRYNVKSLNGFSLAALPDIGSPASLPLHVETPVIRFVIEPSQQDDPGDRCNTRSRQSFHDLVTLLQLPLYVDFPDYSDACHMKDPQKASLSSRSLLGYPRGQNIADYLATALYLFVKPTGDCHAPALILTIGP